MNIIEEIEQSYKFNYPELYKQLFADKMLDCGEYGPNWHSIYYEKLSQNPPLLFWGNDFELLEFPRIKKEINELRNPNDYRKIPSAFFFIPFAQTGAGDLYVFQFDKQQNGEIPVTLLYHDEENGVVLSKNLQDFIFRQLLETVAEIDEFSTIAEENFESNLSNILRTHKPYLTEKQFEIISEIYNRDLFEYKYNVPNGREYTAEGLISRNELSKILQQEIGFDKLDFEFVYMG